MGTSTYVTLDDLCRMAKEKGTTKTAASKNHTKLQDRKGDQSLVPSKQFGLFRGNKTKKVQQKSNEDISTKN